MDSATLTKLLIKIHTYPSAGKLNIFFENKNLNKPLQWWLKEIDKSPSSELDKTSFLSNYKRLSNKKLHSMERLDELLNWIQANIIKFKNALESNELSKFRSFILNKEKQLKEDQTGQIELDFYDFLLDAEDADKEWEKILKTIKSNSLEIENIRRSDEHDLGVIVGKVSDIKKFLEWYTDGSGLEHEYFDFIEPVEKKTKK